MKGILTTDGSLRGILSGSSDLVGALSNATLRGEKVELRCINNHIQYKYENDEEWQDLITIDTQSEKVELRAVNGVIQYKYENDTEWQDLIDIRAEGVGNYDNLTNLPQINGVELKSQLTIEDLGEETLTNSEIMEIIDSQYNNIFGGNH